MLQTYLLCQVYLLISAGLLLSDLTWSKLLFLVSLRSRVDADRKTQLVLKLAGFVTCLLLLAFPANPGPRGLGDALPALCCLMLSVLYVSMYRKDGNGVDKKKQHAAGRTALAVFAVHMLLPFLVLV